jgi:hypothetical protein
MNPKLRQLLKESKGKIKLKAISKKEQEKRRNPSYKYFTL